MSGKPAARITDPTACPVSGHGTNSLVTGSSDVIFEGLGAARLNDTSACGRASLQPYLSMASMPPPSTASVPMAIR